MSIHQMLLGTMGGERITLPNSLLMDGYSMDVPCTSTITFAPNGNWSLIDTETTAQSGTWLGSGAASAYDVRCSVNSGTVSGDTTATWLTMANTRRWWENAGVGASNKCQLLINVRDASTLTVVDSCVVELISWADMT